MVDQPGLVTSNVQCLTINWNKSVLCQEDTPEVLRCPPYSKGEAEGVGYKTVTDHSMGFDRVSCMTKIIYWGYDHTRGQISYPMFCLFEQQITRISNCSQHVASDQIYRTRAV